MKNVIFLRAARRRHEISTLPSSLTPRSRSLSRSRLRADFCFWIFGVTSMRRCCVFSQEFIGFSAVI